MSHSALSCPRCGQQMERGFVLDRTYGANVQSMWVPGKPEVARLFGMATGTLHVDEKQACAVTCFRCTACSYLEFYAFPQQTAEAETMLLRAAQGTAPADAQQLLRGSLEEDEQAA